MDEAFSRRRTPLARRFLVRSAGPLALAVVGLMLLFRGGLDVVALTESMDGFGAAAPIVFVAIGVVLMSVMVPKTIVSIAAGALFGTGMGTAVMLVTAVIAALANYAIGRWWLGGTLSKWMDRDVGGPSHEWVRMVGLVAKDAGWFVHLLFRLTPVPTMVISYLMGACRARLAPFIAAAAIAIIPQSLWVHSGTAVRLVDDRDAGGLHWAGIVVSIVAAIGIGVVVPRTATRRLRSHQKRVAEMETNSENRSQKISFTGDQENPCDGNASEHCETESTNSRPPMVFESAVDRWLVLVMAMAPLTSLGLGVYAWWIGQPDGAAILFASGAAATLVMTAITFPCRYTLLDDTLSIRFGMLIRRIPLSEIVAAGPTASLRSGPALSLQRIEIRTQTRSTVVSPKDRAGFLRELRRRGVKTSNP